MMNRDPRHLTAREASKKCTGAIHSFLSIIRFFDPDGKVADEKRCLGLSRQNPVGTEVQFASIYMHLSGVVAMHTTDFACVTLKTLEEEIIPRMRQFEKVMAEHDIASLGDLEPIARLLGIESGVGCSQGGCDVCRPYRKGFKKARQARAKAAKGSAG